MTKRTFSNVSAAVAAIFGAGDTLSAASAGLWGAVRSAILDGYSVEAIRDEAGAERWSANSSVRSYLSIASRALAAGKLTATTTRGEAQEATAKPRAAKDAGREGPKAAPAVMGAVRFDGMSAADLMAHATPTPEGPILSPAALAATLRRLGWICIEPGATRFGADDATADRVAAMLTADGFDVRMPRTKGQPLPTVKVAPADPALATVGPDAPASDASRFPSAPAAPAKPARTRRTRAAAK